MQRKEEPEREKDPAKGDEDGPASSHDAADLEDAPPTMRSQKTKIR